MHTGGMRVQVASFPYGVERNGSHSSARSTCLPLCVCLCVCVCVFVCVCNNTTIQTEPCTVNNTRPLYVGGVHIGMDAPPKALATHNSSFLYILEVQWRLL